MLLYPAVPTILLININILLVPLATFEGSPKKIRTGSVNKDPPPAKVLTILATNPTEKRIK